MASLFERVATELRKRILNGELAPGERIREQEFAPVLGVSRTPLRLALSELEKQGFVEVVGKRGFQVRRITLQQIAEAIDVRGVLEGFGARLLAERGMDDETEAALTDCVNEGRAILDSCQGGQCEVDTAAWAEMNARFHQILQSGADNSALRSALDHVNKVPLTAAGALGFSGVTPAVETPFFMRSQSDHEDILSALLNREGSRVDALMREHARRSRDNKHILAQLAGPLAIDDDERPQRPKRRKRT